MDRAAPLSVLVDLSRVRQNAEAIVRKVGRGVDVLATVKADAYGLGAERVSDAVGSVVRGWCVFSPLEAEGARLWERTGRGSIVLGPPAWREASQYRARGIRPAVTNVEEARRLREADPLVCVDTGMQRFTCPPEDLDAVIEAGGCREAFTHATRLEHVTKLKELVGNRGLRIHAAATSLLDEPAAWLDAVRPGYALYCGAMRVVARLVDARDGRGPAGYSGFVTSRHGVILCGYSQGLRKGPCMVNGVRRNILEVGMQSAFVELGARDKAGDEAVLLGEEVLAEDVAKAWNSSPHEVLTRMGRLSERNYVG